METPHEAIASIINYLIYDEHRDWIAQGRPRKHVYRDLKVVADWLERHPAGEEGAPLVITP